MSQFRNKNLHLGLVDTWDFKINDQGAIEGDDIVAEDPNELAQAISDTQDLLLKTSVTAPGDLINPNSGVLERIKHIEDTVGSTSLQMAYDEGNIIAVSPGRDLMFGASGDIRIDSSKNITVEANTFKVKNGLTSMLIYPDGVRSYEGDLSLGTTYAGKTTTLSSNGPLVLKDENLTASITLSDPNTNPTLVTSSQSLVGAINEIASGFGSTGLQDVYDQGSTPEIQTENSKGSIIIREYIDSVPALTIDGSISCYRKIQTKLFEIKDGLATTLSINESGTMLSEGIISSNTRVDAPVIGGKNNQLILTDDLGAITLTETGHTLLNTSHSSLFGALNELHEETSQSLQSIAILNLEHDLSSGKHGKITTQASTGHNQDKRITVLNDSGAETMSINGEGAIIAENMTLNMYNVTTELFENKNHRLDDGTSHSAVNNHINTAINPHNTVNSLKVQGGIELKDDISLVPGTGVTLTQAGQEITISTSSGTTLQGVYDNQSTGNLILDTLNSKDLSFLNSSNELLISIRDQKVEIGKELSLTDAVGSILAIADLELKGSENTFIKAAIGDVNLEAESMGKTVKIESVPFTDGQTNTFIDGLEDSVVGTINQLGTNFFTTGTNATGVTQHKGTVVIFREDGTFQIPYSNIKNSCMMLNRPIAASNFIHAFGVLAEDIAPWASGVVQTGGTITADVGEMSPGLSWRKNDSLLIARCGKATAKIVAPNDGDYISISGKNYTAKASGADPALGQFDIAGTSNADKDATRDNLLNALNNTSYMGNVSPNLFINAFVGGEKAKGRIDISANCSAGDNVVLTPQNGISGGTVTLTAVAHGTTPGYLEFEIGYDKNETLLNLSNAINRTTLSNGSGGDGHGCIAKFLGSFIQIEWRAVGSSGNDIALSATTGSSFIFTNPTGGTSEIEIYTTDRSADNKTVSASAPTRFSLSSFSDDEGDSQLISLEQWNSLDRVKDDDDRKLKIGKVISYSGTNLTFLINIEEPRGINKREGYPYDIEY